MKSTRFLIILLLLLNMQLSAQVFTRADFAYANQWYTYQTDTNPSSKIKVRFIGPSNTWNFSTGLKNHLTDSISFEDTINYPNKPLGCNLVQVSNTAINYLKVDADGVKAFLNLGNFTDTNSTLKNLITQYPLPLSYLSEVKDSLSATTVQSVTDLGLDNPLYDSLKTDVKVLFHTLVDASGLVITPKGRYEQTLRVRSTQQPIYLFYGRNKTTGIYEPLNIPIPYATNLYNTDTTYTWWVYKKGYYIAQAITNGRLIKLSYLLNSSQGSANIKELEFSNINIYPNPCREKIYIEPDFLSFDNYTIFNFQGVLVQEGYLSSEINIENLSSGIYLLRLFDFSGKTTSKQFVHTF